MQLRYATIIVAILPILFIYPFLQKYFAKGVLIGGHQGVISSGLVRYRVGYAVQIAEVLPPHPTPLWKLVRQRGEAVRYDSQAIGDYPSRRSWE